MMAANPRETIVVRMCRNDLMESGLYAEIRRTAQSVIIATTEPITKNAVGAPNGTNSRGVKRNVSTHAQ